MTSPVRGVGPISVAARRCVGRTRGRRQASRKRKRTGRRRRRRRRRRRLGCRWAPVKIRWTGRRELQSRPRVAAAPASILTIRFGFFGQRTPGRLFSAPLRPGRQRVSAFFFCKQKRGFRYFPFTCWSTTSALDGLRSGDALAHSVVTKKKSMKARCIDAMIGSNGSDEQNKQKEADKKGNRFNETFRRRSIESAIVSDGSASTTKRQTIRLSVIETRANVRNAQSCRIRDAIFFEMTKKKTKQLARRPTKLGSSFLAF